MYITIVHNIVTFLNDFRIISMKIIYMECTFNMMPKTRLEIILKEKPIMKKLSNGKRYMVIVTNLS